MSVAPLLLIATLCGQAPEPGRDAADFAAVVALFEAKCVRCHGGTATKGGLSLVTAEALRRGGQSGPVIEPGQPDESGLIDQITGPEAAMPKGGPALSEAEVAAVRRWIAAGARWPEGTTLVERKADAGPWWAIQPLRSPAVPVVRDPARGRGPIDAFLLAALDAKGLTFRPESDRRTLIRRLTFDLTGLPPTAEQVDAFAADDRPDAYERLVDRLLASPHHGERWGRHWLDIVHYGDTHGYDKDKRRDRAWLYRDYVIGALNDDTPYDTFVTEQLAGDVRTPGDPRGVIATGFIAAGPWDFVGHAELREGTVEKEKTRLVDRDDMVTNAMSTFTSLTVHCARCHDHKFDPISQRDYYRLQAVFAGVDRGNRPYESPEAAKRRAQLVAARDAAAADLKWAEAQAKTRRSPDLEKAEENLETHRVELERVETQLPQGTSPSNGFHSAIHPTPDATEWVQVDLGRAVPIQTVVLVPARPTDFPDTPGFGFPPSFRVEVCDEADFGKPVQIARVETPDDQRQADRPYVIQPQAVTARYVRVTATRLWPRTGDFVFALGEVQVVSAGANVARNAPVQASSTIDAGRWHTRFLVDGHSSRHPLPETIDNLQQYRLGLLLSMQGQERHWREQREAAIGPALLDAIGRARSGLALAEKVLAGTVPTDSVYAPVPREPRPIRVLARGDVEQPGEPVEPGALACVPGLDPDFAATASQPEAARRAALADWITSPTNPLTWRSIANRVWQYHFGRGLVASPNDFGRNGTTPTHPELLDWLAAGLRDGDRSLKGLHRQIVQSAAYRQGTADDSTADQVDAGNTLLWRQNRRRLEAEELRDAVLAASGRLDTRMGGPGFEVFRFKDDHSPIYDHFDPQAIVRPEGFRRAVYRFTVRSVPNPFLDCLDGADPNTNLPVRSETLTALQALALLNDPFMLAQAQALADRIQAEAGDDPEAAVTAALRRTLGRAPEPAERAALIDYARRRGLPALARLLFNANEFVFVD